MLRLLKTSNQLTRSRKGAGGKTFTYINRATAMMWLDEHYPDWSMEVSYPYKDGEMMNIRVKIDTGLRQVECWGSENDKGEEFESVKAAESDALKRCCFTLGGFTDIYAPEDYKVLKSMDEESKHRPREVLGILEKRKLDEGLIRLISDYVGNKIDRVMFNKLLGNK